MLDGYKHTKWCNKLSGCSSHFTKLLYIAELFYDCSGLNAPLQRLIESQDISHMDASSLYGVTWVSERLPHVSAFPNLVFLAGLCQPLHIDLPCTSVVIVTPKPIPFIELCPTIGGTTTVAAAMGPATFGGAWAS